MHKDNRHKPGEESKYCKQRWDRTCFYAAFYLNKGPEFTSKKHKKPCKGDKISKALSTFTKVQREQQQLFMEVEERQAQKELELEEKRMKLEQENDQCRETYSKLF